MFSTRVRYIKKPDDGGISAQAYVDWTRCKYLNSDVTLCNYISIRFYNVYTSWNVRLIVSILWMYGWRLHLWMHVIMDTGRWFSAILIFIILCLQSILFLPWHQEHADCFLFFGRLPLRPKCALGQLFMPHQSALIFRYFFLLLFCLMSVPCTKEELPKFISCRELFTRHIWVSYKLYVKIHNRVMAQIVKIVVLSIEPVSILT